MSKTDKQLTAQLENLAVLVDPVRRALYLHVRSQTGDTPREAAARALGISRSLAAFHLDKLVEAGLLEASFRRLSGRGGPGAGRPSKVYRPSARQVDVSLPARRYELAAGLLTRALDDAGVDAAAALTRNAEARGREWGAEAREQLGTGATPERVRRGMLDVLRAAGFEPRMLEREGIALGNCPFQSLAQQSAATICGMNLALCRGLVAGLEAPQWEARLAPGPGRCCVVFGGG